MNTLYFFNTTIMPNEGLFSNEKISVENAKKIVSDWGGEQLSAVGHEATAQAMSVLLEQSVKVNRIYAQMKPGDVAICLKVRGRLPEGKILELKDLEEIGYDLLFMQQHEKEVVT